jgi:tape measure domain-containing protein
MADQIIIDFKVDNQDLVHTIDLLEKLGSIDKKTADEFRAANKAYIERRQATVEAAKATEDLGKKAEQAGKKVKDSSTLAASGMEKLSNTLKSIGGLVAGAFAVTQLVAFGKEAINLSANFNSVRNALNFIQGGAQQGGQAFEFLRDLSERLGLELVSTANAFKLFSASAQLGGISADQTKEIFTSVAEATTALGLSADDTQGVFLALSQIISKGTVQAEELRGQIGERLPGAFELAAKSMGVTTKELNKLLEGGKVVAKDFLPGFAATLKETFGGALPQAVNGARANLNRLSNLFTEFKVSVGDSLNSVIGGLFKTFGSPLSEKIQEEANNLEIARVKILSYNVGQKERTDLIKALQSQYPDYLGNINAETVSNEDLNIALNKVNGSLVVKIALQKTDEQITEQQEKTGESLAALEEARAKAIQQIVNVLKIGGAANRAYNDEQLKGLSIEEQIFLLLNGGIKLRGVSAASLAGLGKAQKELNDTQLSFNSESLKTSDLLKARVDQERNLISIYGISTTEQKKEAQAVKQLGDSLDQLKLKLAALQKQQSAIPDALNTGRPEFNRIGKEIETIQAQIDDLTGKLRDKSAQKEENDRKKNLERLHKLEQEASDDLLKIKSEELGKIAELETEKQLKLKEIAESFAKATGNNIDEILKSFEKTGKIDVEALVKLKADPKEVAKLEQAIKDIQEKFDTLTFDFIEQKNIDSLKSQLDSAFKFIENRAKEASDAIEKEFGEKKLKVTTDFNNTGDFSTEAQEKYNNDVIKLDRDKEAKLLEIKTGADKQRLDATVKTNVQIARIDETKVVDTSKLEQTITEDQQAELDARIKNAEEYSDRIKQLNEEELAGRQAIKDKLIELSHVLVDSLSTIFNNYYDAQAQRIEDNKQNILDSYDEQLEANEELHNKEKRGDREYERQKQDLLEKRKAEEKKADKELRKIRHDQAVYNRDIAILNATLSGIQGVARAFADYAYPYDLIVAGIVGGIAAAEVAAAASTPIPAFAKGTEKVTGQGHDTSDNVHAMLSPGERVVPAKRNRDFFPILSAIHNEKFAPDELNRIAKLSPQELKALPLLTKSSDRMTFHETINNIGKLTLKDSIATKEKHTHETLKSLTNISSKEFSRVNNSTTSLKEIKSLSLPKVPVIPDKKMRTDLSPVIVNNAINLNNNNGLDEYGVRRAMGKTDEVIKGVGKYIVKNLSESNTKFRKPWQ